MANPDFDFIYNLIVLAALLFLLVDHTLTATVCSRPILDAIAA